MESVLLQTDIPVLPKPSRGKVRDIYDLGDQLLIVATDRISAFDCILPTPIPGKGKVLTAMSVFWFNLMKDLVPNHLITADFDEIVWQLSALANFRDQLEGRSMLVRKAKRLDAECIVRGYITGSGLSDYQKTGKVCGIALPSGLVESQKLPENIFTPSTKAETGHDENVSLGVIVEMLGYNLANELQTLSLEIYEKARAYAETKGIIIADTKFEFGLLPDGTVILIDEILTPDSSRFWPAEDYKPGRSQKSFDKQYVRDWLTATGWDKKQETAPELPPEIVAKTVEKYQEALRLLIGA
jgi:phosphoribosylaminoimidazole-succinocarboxamide synthase